MDSVTLSELKTQVRETADMVGSSFIEDPELTRYIDLSYAELYDILVSKFEDYRVIGPKEYTVSSGNTLSLPSDFYKLRSIDVQAGGGLDGWLPIRKFMLDERYKTNTIGTRNILGINNVQYRIIDNKIVFYPETNATGKYRLWYIPTRSKLEKDKDFMDGVNGWHQYVIIDAAIKCLRKEETDITALLIEKKSITDRIESMASNRDASAPERVTDVIGD